MTKNIKRGVLGGLRCVVTTLAAAVASAGVVPDEHVVWAVAVSGAVVAPVAASHGREGGQQDDGDSDSPHLCHLLSFWIEQANTEKAFSSLSFVTFSAQHDILERRSRKLDVLLRTRTTFDRSNETVNVLDEYYSYNKPHCQL